MMAPAMLPLVMNNRVRMNQANNFRNWSLAVCGAMLISACSTTPNKAPVIERTPVPQAPESPVAVPVAKPKTAESTQATYVVKRGDTLYRIALDHGQSYSDLVVWNDLKNPNDIKVGQVLKVSPPESVVAANGNAPVQTVPVTNSAVEVKPLGQAVSGNKVSPRGDKRPYSEANLAELQKQDGAAAPVAAATTAATVAAKADQPVVVAKPAEKPAEAAATESIDWMWPVDGKVLSTYTPKTKGVDIAGRMGQDVYAAAAGKVMYVGSGIRGYGNLVIIRHTGSLLSAYAHNKTILVKEGQAISKGQKIAEMGNSDSDTVKLHFEVRMQGDPVDPAKYLPAR